MTDLKRVKKVINWLIFQDFAENEKGVADIIGYTKSSFSQIINGKVPLSERFIDKLASIDENINKVWIKTGVGEMLKENTNYMQITYKLETDNNVINQAIPIYEIDATAGHITLFDNQITQNPVGKISIPNAPKCDGALYVRGDSMYPILKAGDIVAYKIINDPNNIFWGEMYLIDIDVEGEQHLTIKYIQRSERGDEYVYLVSHNSNHQPIHILKSNIRALALIKASIRYNSMG